MSLADAFCTDNIQEQKQPESERSSLGFQGKLNLKIQIDKSCPNFIKTLFFKKLVQNIGNITSTSLSLHSVEDVWGTVAEHFSCEQNHSLIALTCESLRQSDDSLMIFSASFGPVVIITMTQKS